MEPEPITTSGLLPPLTVGRSARHGPCWEKTDKPTWEEMSADEHHTQRLPPIAESRSVTPSRATQREARPKADTAAFKSQENVKRLHQQPLFLPLLFPEEIHGKQRGEGEKTEKRHFKKVTVGQRGGGGGGGGGSMLVMQPGAEPPPPPPLPPPGGVMGCVAGRKGPGRQSSLAFLQNQDPCEPSDGSRGVIRGLLPLQLRDLQDGRSAGSLIMGPDGEIIHLSLYDSQDSSHGDGDTRDQALQVLSAEGEKLPWVIVLQPEHTHAEGGVDLHTDLQHHQSGHKRTESQFAAAESSFSSEQLLELHRSSNTCSPGSHADPVDVTQKKRKNAEKETWTAPKKDAKPIVRLPPVKEQVEKEVLKGGHAEAEEDEDEEEQHSTGRTGSESGSHQQREKLQLKDEASLSRQNINPNKTEDVVDKRKKNTKRKEAEEAAITTGKRDGKTMKSAASDGQKRSGTRKEGKWQREKTGSDARPIRSQREEERTSREAAETLEHSALPSKKKMTNREGERGEVTMKEEREESAGRRMMRRRGRLKLKELVAENHEDPLENEEVEINQRMEEESRPESTKMPSATRRHKNKTNTSSVGDADDRSSVRSVSSLTSAAAASQLHKSSWRRSAASSCEGTVLASAGGLTPSRGRLSSCSAVMVTEEQLMLNPVKPESSRPTKSQEDEAAALRQRAERRRQEVERKRRQQEEEERKQQERERTEDRMKSELEEERRKRAEELRLKRLAEEEGRRKREEEEQERARREQAQRERERRRQEERRRQMERLQRTREEEEQRRKAELERLRLEEERRQEEESKKLQEMDESERMEYLRRKEQEEEDRRQKQEERKRKEEEAALWAAEEARLQAELLARQVALLQQQLAFKRGLVFEAGGLEQTQGISRPWIYSYFTLLQLLGLNPTKAETTSPDL